MRPIPCCPRLSSFLQLGASQLGRLLLGTILLAGLLVVAESAHGQLSNTLLPAQLPTVSSDVERQLAQVDTLIAAEAWEEGIDAVLRLRDEADADLMVEVNPGYFLPLGEVIGRRIARWPAEGIAAYRRRIDPTAKAEFEVAATARSREQLARVAHEYFASSVGDDALWVLGTLELERGHYNAARRAWLRLAAELTAPDGRPWGIALAGADLTKPDVWQRVERHLTADDQRQTGLVCYPDTELPLAEIHARLAMVSIREQNFARAEAEIALLGRLYGDAQGVVGGREVPLAETLAATLATARQWPGLAPRDDWPTFAGTYQRVGRSQALVELRGTVWSNNLAETPSSDATRQGQQARFELRSPLRQVTPPPVEAVGGDGALVLLGESQLLAFDLQSGSPLFGKTGEVFRENSLWPPPGLGQAPIQQGQRQIVQLRQRDLIVQHQLQLNIALNQRVILGQPMLGSRFIPFELPTRSRMVTLSGNKVYAVLSPGGNQLGNPRQAPRRHLMAFDLTREGKLVLDLPPGGKEWQFSGPAVVTDEWIYIAMREGTTSDRLHVACFSRDSGRMVWRRKVATLAAAEGNEHQDLLTLAGQTLYLNSNAGVVVALAATDGAPLWSHAYPQASPADLRAGGLYSLRPPSPALIAGGAVVCLPSDSTGMFALDAASGRPIWIDNQTSDIRDLLGVIDGVLISSGKRLLWTDLLTGERRFAWPDSAAAGVEGMGRGAIAGREVFWPTAAGILVFDLQTGAQSRRPLEIPSHMDGSVNLIPLAPYLVILSTDHVAVLGPEGGPPPSDRETAPTEDSADPPAVEATLTANP